MHPFRPLTPRETEATGTRLLQATVEFKDYPNNAETVPARRTGNETWSELVPRVADFARTALVVRR